MIPYHTIFAGVISPHDALDGTQQSLEAILSERRHLDLGGADDGSSAGRIIEQGQFAKVVSLVVYLDGLLDTSLVYLGGARFENVEGLADITLLNDGGVGNVQSNQGAAMTSNGAPNDLLSNFNPLGELLSRDTFGTFKMLAFFLRK